MSISSEISRLGGNLSDAFDAVGAMGGTVPSGANSDDLAAAIHSIPASSNEFLIEVSLPDGISIQSTTINMPSGVTYGDVTDAIEDGKNIVVLLHVDESVIRVPLNMAGFMGAITFSFGNSLYHTSVVLSSNNTITISHNEVNFRKGIPAQKITDYLYFFDVDFDLDYNKALEYAREHSIVSGAACSVVRKGNLFGRNMDWLYSETAEFIVNTKAIKGRHASIGVATGLPALTNTFAQFGTWSDLYTLIPFGMTDGINDRGVVVEMNTVSRPNYYATIDDDNDVTLTLSMIPRYVLDHANSADHAIQLLQSVDIIPPFSDLPSDLHFMIADANKTYVVEYVPDGNGGTEVVVLDLTDDPDYWPIMTNFYLDTYFDRGTIIGSGFNRYNTLVNGYNELYTKQDVFELLAEAYSTVANNVTLGIRNGTQTHTAHSVVYDFDNKSMTIMPQPDVPNPTGEVYSFAVNNEIFNRSAEPEVFWVESLLDLQAFQILNLSHTYSEIFAAYQAGKSVKIRFTYYFSPTTYEVSMGDLRRITIDNALTFDGILTANFGGGFEVYHMTLYLSKSGRTTVEIRLLSSTQIV